MVVAEKEGERRERGERATERGESGGGGRGGGRAHGSQERGERELAASREN